MKFEEMMDLDANDVYFFDYHFKEDIKEFSLDQLKKLIVHIEENEIDGYKEHILETIAVQAGQKFFTNDLVDKLHIFFSCLGKDERYLINLLYDGKFEDFNFVKTFVAREEQPQNWNPMYELAAKILADDPIATDIAQDVIAKGG